MKNGLSVCGCECPACEYFEKSECAGCSEIKGKVWWLGYINAEVCPIYDCVTEKKNYAFPMSNGNMQATAYGMALAIARDAGARILH